MLFHFLLPSQHHSSCPHPPCVLLLSALWFNSTPIPPSLALPAEQFGGRAMPVNTPLQLAPLTSRQPHTHSMSNKNQLFSSGNKWWPCFYGSMNCSAILDINLLLSRRQRQQIQRSVLEAICCDGGIWSCVEFGFLRRWLLKLRSSGIW